MGEKGQEMKTQAVNVKNRNDRGYKHKSRENIGLEEKAPVTSADTPATTHTPAKCRGPPAFTFAILKEWL